MSSFDELADLRLHYTLAGLSEADLAESPLDQFDQWMLEAISGGVLEPNGMTLATADPLGCPTARTVLLKRRSGDGFTFFTNYTSRKAQELEANPHASLLFWWKELERQIGVRGVVSRVSPEESDEYFQSRPYESRIGAWVSRQGAVIPNRSWLEERDKAYREQYPDHVPTPEFWGGFILRPLSLEFWQGRPGRLHDRFIYRRDDLDSPLWSVSRLSP